MGRGHRTARAAAQTPPKQRASAPRRPPFPDLGVAPEPVQLRAALREVGQRSHRDSRRLLPVQELCVAAIERRNGPECVPEMAVASLYGDEVWDVATPTIDDVPLCISAKTMSSSRHHNVGNRVREMCGEAAAVRARARLATLGFLCVIEASTPGRIGGRESRHSDLSIAEAIGLRCGNVERYPHHFDVGCVLSVDFERGSYRALNAPGLRTFAEFLDDLVKLWEKRAALSSDNATRAHAPR